MKRRYALFSALAAFLVALVSPRYVFWVIIGTISLAFYLAIFFGLLDNFEDKLHKKFQKENK